MLIDRVAHVPSVELAEDPAVDAAVDESVRYLESPAALRSLELDPYWPKWHSPWWHMLLLWELGLAGRIPERIARGMVERLDRLSVKIFPIHPGELPAGADPSRETACHCALGTVGQVLGACGIDVERELPWGATEWFVRYQMADGGLSCDDGAYLVEHECPSSMVGTVPPLEAMLATATTPERERFVDRAAAFLIERRLVLGSSTVHNADERNSAPAWLLPTFPRFYLYDVLRGLHALVRWAEVRRRAIPVAAIEPAVTALLDRAGAGVVRVARHAFEPMTTRVTDPPATTRQPATSFPLLEATSVIGAASPALTRQWQATRRALVELHQAKLVVE